MARAKKFRWGAIGLAILVAIAGVGLWVMPSRQTSSAQDTPKAAPPLIARGYTDAPEGTAVVAGDPAGGSVLVELRVKDGQKVKKGEVARGPVQLCPGGRDPAHGRGRPGQAEADA